MRGDTLGTEGGKEQSGIDNPEEERKVSKTGEDTVTAQEEEGTRTEGRRWGTEASVPDQAWEGLGRLGPGRIF